MDSVTSVRIKPKIFNDSEILRKTKRGIAADAVSSSEDLADRFPWYTPSISKIKEGKIRLFPEEITDEEIEYRYRRFALVKVIIDDPVEDALRNGFFIENKENEGDETLDSEFQSIYDAYVKRPFMKALKMSRAYGYSFLYLAYRDNIKDLSVARPTLSGKNTDPYIKYLYPISKRISTINTTDQIPKSIKNIDVEFTSNEKSIIHPSRLVHLEHGALDYDLKGRSVLESVWDLLTILKHAEWSIGQELWRGASGLLCLFAPAGADAVDAADALNAVDNISSKTRLALPPGWTAKDIAPSRISYDVKASYETIVRQISAGTRIPNTVLLPAVKASSPREYEDFLFTTQVTEIEPSLRTIFRLFQRSGQITNKSFRIRWFSKTGDAQEEAKTKYLRALAKRLELKNQESMTLASELKTKTAGEYDLR